MRLLRISNLLSLFIAGFFGVLLFWASQSVQEKEGRLSDLKQSINQERQSIQTLSAEWEYLRRPQRLEELAEKHLDMSPVRSDQVNSESFDIPEPVLPQVPSHKPPEFQPVSMGEYQ